MAAADAGSTNGRRPALIGRTDELARLQDIADLAVEDGCQLVLVSGDAGIGKSSLMSMFLAKLGAAGWGTHTGHCIEFADRPLPFGPVVAILRSILLDDLEHVDDLIGHHRDDLAALLPELRDDAGSAGAASFDGDVDRLFDAIANTIGSAASRRPLAVLVEDVHWADAATRDLLASLVRTVAGGRLLLLATERTGAVDRAHPLRTWMAEQRRFPRVHSFELEGFSQEEIAEQALTILGYEPEHKVVERLHDRTAGNAYFAHELLVAHAAGSDELPTSLVSFLTSRLERLDPSEREVLRALAVAGGVASHRLLAAMLPALSIGPYLRSLFDASIVVVDGSDYTLGHQLLREAIMRDVLPFEAEELHRRAAEAMEADLGPASAVNDLVELAVHWDNANDRERSLARSVEAAEAAAAVAVYETAADMALQALRAWPEADDQADAVDVDRYELLLRAAEWLTSCYRGAEAVSLINDALATWASDVTDGRRALMLARMVTIEFHLGNPVRAAELLREAEHLVGDEVSAEAAQVHHRVAKQAVAEGKIHPALQSAERAIAIATTEGPEVVLVEALTTKALAVGVTRDLDAGVELAREARALALRHGFVSQVARTYRTEMLVCLYRDGRTPASLDALTEGLAYAEQHCGPRWRAEFRHDLALGYVEAGQLTDAQPLLEQLQSSDIDDLFRLWILQTSSLYALGIGALVDAQRWLDEANEIADRYESAQETGVQARLGAELARRHGDLDTALDLIDRALELQLPNDNITYTRESILEKVRIVRAMVDLGRPDTAELLDSSADLVRKFDGDGVANVAMKAVMQLELAAARGDDVGPALVSETVDLLETSGFYYEAAQARLLGLDQLMSGQQRDRHRLQVDLSELLEIANTRGMVWIAERVAALARGSRITLDQQAEAAPPAPKTPEALPHHLTTREVEVMSLLAEGLTNKAIGQQLYVSPRTVSTHISNLLAKLGVASRGEAAAAYHRLGLDEVIDLRTPVPIAE